MSKQNTVLINLIKVETSLCIYIYVVVNTVGVPRPIIKY